MSEIKQVEGNTLRALCRICAKQSDKVVDLFTAEHNGKKIVDMLVFCLKQLVRECDGFPGIVCEDCKSDLIKVYAFHTRYNDSEQQFRRMLSPSTVNKVKVEAESESDEQCQNQIKLENDGHIVVLPDISYFDNDHFETQRLQDTVVNDSSDMSQIKEDSIQRRSKKSKKISGSKKTTQRMPTHRQKSELFECFQCKKCFNRFSSLQRHASTHHVDKEKPYECTECRIQFVYMKSLFRHRRQKHSDRIYECEYCPEAFESLSKLKRHVNGAHKHELKAYKCDLCSKTFVLRFQLACHQTDDVCSQSFQCTTCDETFPLHRMLKTHIRDKHTSKCFHSQR